VVVVVVVVVEVIVVVVVVVVIVVVSVVAVVPVVVAAFASQVPSGNVSSNLHIVQLGTPVKQSAQSVVNCSQSKKRRQKCLNG
jgi:hypothetical protein